MNFLGEGVSPEFLHAIRRVGTRQDFFDTCRAALDHDDPMPLIPADRQESGKTDGQDLLE